ncbi:hypothetical protein T492DRAFT_1126399, partial [Pavlovales sp. CCMP2436]
AVLPSVAQLKEIDEVAYDSLVAEEVTRYEAARTAHKQKVRARENERSAASAVHASRGAREGKAWRAYMRGARELQKCLLGEPAVVEDPKAKKGKPVTTPSKAGGKGAPPPPPVDEDLPAPYATVFDLEPLPLEPAPEPATPAPADTPTADGAPAPAAAAPEVAAATPAAEPAPPPTRQAVRAVGVLPALAERLGGTYLAELLAVSDEPLLDIPTPRTRQLIRMPKARPLPKPVKRFF